MDLPLISVIIPTHNRPHLLPVAVQSVLAQTYAHLEVIIIDDASQPAVVLATLPQDARLRLIRQEFAHGAAAARNLGMQTAHGDFFAFLDDDDYYFPHKLQVQLDYLLTHPEIDMVFSRVEYHYGNGKKECYQNSYDGWFNNFINLNTIHTNSSLFRRQIFSHIRFDERLSKYDDMHFYLSASLSCQIAYLPDIVAVWNMDNRPDQLTHKGHYCRNYYNFRLICEHFENTVDSYPLLRRIFYKKLLVYSVLCLKWLTSIRLLFKLLGYGRLNKTE
jgi:glycosyltransferase involved in cell wall biosynthesis